MADNWFFLSHARLDRDNDPDSSITTFFKDVNAELKRKKVIREGDAGFFDGTGIQQGSDWSQTLGEALRTCRVLVCMYSAAYFQSDWCGREWAVFYSRLEQYMGKLSNEALPPPLIMPVLLDPPEDLRGLQLPDPVKARQNIDDDYPEVYRENGLKFLMARPTRHGEDYKDVKDIFIKKLVAATNEHPLPDAPKRVDMETVRSAFILPSNQEVAALSPNAAARPAPDVSGTRFAKFVYVAARRDEMEQAKVRGNDGLVYYGKQGGLDWKLYYPDVQDEVVLLAQQVAIDEGFIPLTVEHEADLLQLMKEAEQLGRIVVIIADTWTLCLDKYRDLMLSHDDFNSLNCSVLVAWNNKDSETESNRVRLQQAISRAFRKKSRLKDERYFVDTIGSPEDLRKFLAMTLQKIRSQIIDVTKDYATIEGAEITNLPIIAGPVSANLPITPGPVRSV